MTEPKSEIKDPKLRSAFEEGMRLISAAVDALGEKNPEDAQKFSFFLTGILEQLSKGSEWRKKAEAKIIELAAKAEAGADWKPIPSDRKVPAAGVYVTIPAEYGVDDSSVEFHRASDVEKGVRFTHAQDTHYMKIEPIKASKEASKEEGKQDEENPPF